MTWTSPTSSLRGRRGYTMMEIMTVVAIIAILITIGAGVWQALFSPTSIESAQNQISAALNTARTIAMAEQKVTGIMFFKPAPDQAIRVGIVQETPIEAGLRVTKPDGSSGIPPDVLLDMVDIEPAVLPIRVGVQVFNAPMPAAGGRIQDGYIGFNTFPSNAGNPGSIPSIPVGGVVLFDRRGELVQLRYAIRFRDYSTSTSTQFTAIWNRLFPGVAPPANIVGSNFYNLSGPDKDAGPLSSPGLVLFEQERFLAGAVVAGQGFRGSDLDAAFTNGVPYATRRPPPNDQQYEIAEEDWLDANAVPFIVMRYTGILQKVR